jgi:hypothetical protein
MRGRSARPRTSPAGSARARALGQCAQHQAAGVTTASGPGGSIGGSSPRRSSSIQGAWSPPSQSAISAGTSSSSRRAAWVRAYRIRPRRVSTSVAVRSPVAKASDRSRRRRAAPSRWRARGVTGGSQRVVAGPRIASRHAASERATGETAPERAAVSPSGSGCTPGRSGSAPGHRATTTRQGGAAARGARRRAPWDQCGGSPT